MRGHESKLRGARLEFQGANIGTTQQNDKHACPVRATQMRSTTRLLASPPLIQMLRVFPLFKAESSSLVLSAAIVFVIVSALSATMEFASVDHAGQKRAAVCWMQLDTAQSATHLPNASG